ncbi:MAG TPA: hypothetical protein PK014_03115 [Thermoanaerobaculia bacterium]|nr:hypothetical protein [Thermoanaerobaculia bacterium]HUM29048.1 hypothetical protein [Thermoanaerobaculia bacterium]HXK67396.1 hypothetical protein [Thermoanaerobaculia bacterium]
MNRNYRLMAIAVGFLLLTFISGSLTLYAGGRRDRMPRDYKALLEKADSLWAEYLKADKKFHEKGRTDIGSHIVTLAQIHDQLSDLLKKWQQYEMPDGLVSMDLKVGLALELQMSAINAEIIGLLDQNQEMLELSEDLDQDYSFVVDSI